MRDEFEKALNWYIGHQDESWSEDAERFGLKVGRWAREWYCAKYPEPEVVKLEGDIQDLRTENQELSNLVGHYVARSAKYAGKNAKLRDALEAAYTESSWPLVKKILRDALETEGEGE